MSPAVTDPKSRSSSPACIRTVTDTLFSFAASFSAAATLTVRAGTS